jgi:phosphate transport system permease protein
MRKSEKIIEISLAFCTAVTVLTTIGIIWTLLSETFIFFQEVSIIDFLTDTQWTPLFTEKHFGILPLLSGTLLTSLIAITVALPIGLTIAVYLNEYANTNFRRAIKPVLELLASIPTVVYGVFALTVITPFLQKFIPNLSGFNALSPGIVMGIMIIPLISSLSDDAITAIPKAFREGSLALGATRFQTAFKVLIPSASSGIIVAIILSVSRAVGETMIVAVAAGQQPRLTFNPLVPIETITTYIVQISLGDVPQNSLEFRTIFAAGMTLFILTFILNNIGYFLNKKYHARY